MAYSTGMMNKRVKIAKRIDSAGGDFGRSSGGNKYTILGEFWAAESFNKGVKSLREGAIDAYDTVMFRMYYHAGIDRWCLIQYQGRWYQIKSFNESYQDNEIQITAIEMANQNVTIVKASNINN
jgi:SPP1 family predicted phage head-tail adaptor